MLSRIAFTTNCLAKNLNLNKISPLAVGTIRTSSSSSSKDYTSQKEYSWYAEPGTKFPWEGPERDVQNFPRPVLQMEPGKTRFLFVPDEWFQFFYNKTGVTGPYVLGFGLFNYLMSKELWIIDHEYYYVYAAAIIFGVANHKFGDKIATSLDKDIEQDTKELKSITEDELNELTKAMEHEKLLQWQVEAQKLVVEAKKENVAIQQEAAFRERALIVYNEVKKRLEFHSQKQLMERRVSQKHMVQWVVNQVLKSITPQQEKDTLKKCLVDLQALAAKA